MAWDEAWREVAHSAARTLTSGHAEQSREDRGRDHNAGNPGHVQPHGQLPWPYSQYLLIQVDVQGPVRVIGIFVVLVTGQGVLRDDSNAVSGSTHPPHNPTGPPPPFSQTNQQVHTHESI